MPGLTVTLTPEQADFVQRVIESGNYHSREQVIDQALALLSDVAMPDNATLRRAYDQGMASGAPRLTDAENLLQSFKARTAAGG